MSWNKMDHTSQETMRDTAPPVGMWVQTWGPHQGNLVFVGKVRQNGRTLMWTGMNCAVLKPDCIPTHWHYSTELTPEMKAEAEVMG